MERKIGFIGPGKMAKAIVSGIISTSFTAPSNVHIYGRSIEKMAYFADLGCSCTTCLKDFSSCCDIIFLCIKPQNFSEVLEKLKPLVSNKILYVSIAAGITSEKIYDVLGSKVKLIRAMPNTPLLIGSGATAISGGINVSEDDLSTICNVFSSSGEVSVIAESLMNPIIAVSGSSPAYIYLLSKHINDFAVSRGIARDISQKLFCQTLIGSALMLLQSGLSEDELITMVASKGGTTQAALDVLNCGDFKDVLVEAMDACVKRADELGS